jgi:GPH family glycoside/pentoside/hexuronide:cation symporter
MTSPSTAASAPGGRPSASSAGSGVRSASTARIGWGEKISYGVGDLASNLVYVAVGSYLTFFYTDVAGIPATVVGTIFLISRIFDGIYDLFIGVLMEKFHSRFGKARPWLLYLALPYGISAALLFTAPNLGDVGKIVYAYVTYNLTTVIIFTAINVPYGTLNSLMTKDQGQRGLLNSVRMICAYVGTLVVSALTLPLVNAFGGGPHAWTMTFALYGLLATCLFFITFRYCKERVKPARQAAARPSGGDPDQTPAVASSEGNAAGRSQAPSGAQGPTVPMRVAIASLLRNKYWLLIVVFGLIFYTTYNLMGIYPYVATYKLGDANFSSAMFTFRSVIELAGVCLAIPFIRRMGKRNLCLGASGTLLLGQLVIAADSGSLAVVLVGLGIAGLGVGAMFGVVFAMAADTIEYEEWRSGYRSEGIVYAGATFGHKIGGALGGAAIGWILGLSGYIDGGDAGTQPDSALASIDFVFIWLPIILTIPMMVVLSFYRLDKEYPDIVRDLDERAAQVEAAGTGVTTAADHTDGASGGVGTGSTGDGEGR